MTNREMVNNYNALFDFQRKEEQYRARTGEQLLRGRIKATYAIRKNMAEFLDKLKPYDDSRNALIAEYRDQDAERKQYEKAMETYRKKMEKNPDAALAEPEPKIIWREGKTEEEYGKKLDELLDIDVEDVNVHMIDPDVLDGVPLSSTEIGVFMFMLR